MSEPVISIDHIKWQAQAAALKYAEVNDACPYPFHSEAGALFKAEFTLAHQVRAAAALPDLCECDLDLCQQELDTGRCMACGKAVLA